MTSPLSLYIHIPFCQRKCLYCSFKVCVARQGRINDYLEALAKEAGQFCGTCVRTVYFGGGTPSFLSPAQLRWMVGIIQENFDTSAVVEWTIEANPEDIDGVKAEVIKALGFTRVSLGVQSFQEKYLRLLGRCHTAAKAVEAFHLLRRAGIANINLDLVFGFPQQTPQELEADLSAVLSLKSEHVSIYSLTVEPLSRFYVQNIKALDQNSQAQFYENIISRLESAGLPQYEISNFSKAGRESLHNINYWQGGNYFGLGVAAHAHHDGRRSWNVSSLEAYLTRLTVGQLPEEGWEQLSPEARLREALVFGLRMNAGVDVLNLEKRFSIQIPVEAHDKIQALVQQGFLRREGTLLKTTPAGRLVLDEIATRLV